MRQLVCGGQCGRQRRRLVARLCALSVVLTAAAVCWLVYTGSVPDRQLQRQLQLPQWLQDQRRHERRMVSYDDIVSGRANFSLYASDVIVFLHVQKTGGAEFGRQLVQQLQLPRPCSCRRTGGKNRLRCACERPGGAAGDTWLFSSPSVGWPCGVHATWTELVSCVDRQLQLHNNNNSSGSGAQPERRYFYVTWLRDPVQRVLSEWQHTRRGATWLGARHWCRGRSRAPPSCYPPPAAAAGVASNWVNVSLDEFLACDANLAHNRQTRMLADLGQVACYTGGGGSDPRRDALLLDSARHNLRRMAFFGVTEQQRASQTLFERTFRLQFARPFRQRRADATRAALAATALTSRQLQLIRQRNRLDLQLYQHARQLMAQRVQSRADRAEKVD